MKTITLSLSEIEVEIPQEKNGSVVSAIATQVATAENVTEDERDDEFNYEQAYEAGAVGTAPISPPFQHRLRLVALLIYPQILLDSLMKI